MLQEKHTQKRKNDTLRDKVFVLYPSYSRTDSGTDSAREQGMMKKKKQTLEGMPV